VTTQNYIFKFTQMSQQYFAHISARITFRYLCSMLTTPSHKYVTKVVFALSSVILRGWILYRKVIGLCHGFLPLAGHGSCIIGSIRLGLDGVKSAYSKL